MRTIDYDKPLSEEEAEWVEQVGSKRMRTKLAQNQERFGDLEEAASDEEVSDSYENMTLDELKAEAGARKEQGFDTSGIKNKSQLIERLRQWDRDQQPEQE